MNRTLIGFIQKELIQSLRDPAMKFIIIVAPIVQMLLFGLAISNEVKNIRLAAIFEDKDYIMEDIYQHSLIGNWFVPVKTKGDEDPFELIQSGKADVVLVAPHGGLTRAIGRAHMPPRDLSARQSANVETQSLQERQKVIVGSPDAPIQILIDATNVLQGQAVENYLTSIIANVAKLDIAARGLSHQKPNDPPHTLIAGLTTYPPPDQAIQFDVRTLYNPELNTSIFMIPGVMCTLLVFTSLMLTMTAIVREKESGTFEMLISAPLSISEIIYGKTIPYVIVGMFNFVIIFSMALLVFHVPMRGPFWAMVLAAFVFVCTCVAIGALVSTFCQTQQQAALASFWILFPAIMFSGLLFPLDNMPTIIQILAYFDPLAHYLGLLRNILLKGGGLRYVILHTGVLALMAMVCIFISFRRFRTTLQ